MQGTGQKGTGGRRTGWGWEETDYLFMYARICVGSEGIWIWIWFRFEKLADWGRWPSFFKVRPLVFQVEACRYSNHRNLTKESLKLTNIIATAHVLTVLGRREEVVRLAHFVRQTWKGLDQLKMVTGRCRSRGQDKRPAGEGCNIVKAVLFFVLIGIPPLASSSLCSDNDRIERAPAPVTKGTMKWPGDPRGNWFLPNDNCVWVWWIRDRLGLLSPSRLWRLSTVSRLEPVVVVSQGAVDRWCSSGEELEIDGIGVFSDIKESRSQRSKSTEALKMCQDTWLASRSWIQEMCQGTRSAPSS